ncbi:MAG: ABC transporter substrate-binding protein [Syntrophomonadaceae bacterium]|nr:ABC transporter substrate-binding protein [Syntrophomonadaceae bacterium]
MRRIENWRNVLVVLTLATLVLVAVGCGVKSSQTTSTPSEAPQTATKLKVGYSAGGGSLLSFIAQDQGLFEKEGLDVELIPFTSSADGLNALNTGKIDVGISFGTGGPLTFISKGADFVIIGGHLSGGHPIIALPEKAGQFKSIQDFRGKTIATPRLYTSDVVWRGALVKAGFDLSKDVNIIEMKNPQAVLEAVKSGKVDAGIGASSIYLKSKESGLAIVGWSNDLFPNHPCCRVVARGKDVKANPETYRAFLRALIQAEKIKQDDPELAVDVNKRFLKIDDKLARDFTLEPHQIINVDPNRKGVVQMWKQMNDIGYIKSDLDINQHINTDLYKQALEQLAKQNASDEFYKELKQRFDKQN